MLRTMVDYLLQDSPALLIGASVLALAFVGWGILAARRTEERLFPPQVGVTLLASVGVAIAITANLDVRALLIVSFGILVGLAIVLANTAPGRRRRDD